MQANKYYVVWKGYAPGVYDSWEEAEIQVSGYPDASYRAFKTQEAAVEAWREGFDKEGLIQEVAREMARLQKEGTVIEFDENKAENKNSTKANNKNVSASDKNVSNNSGSVTSGTNTNATNKDSATPAKKVIVQTPPPYNTYSIAVDAACSGNPGPMEYRGVYIKTGQVLFKVGPMEQGTNNIGEFLAIVHALAMQEKQGTSIPIYSDSVNAQKWVRQGFCKTTLEENEVNAPIFDLIRRAESWLRTHTFRVPIYKWETKEWGEIPADFGRK